MRTATLHIGPHKTGTTSIQDFLHRNAGRLLSYGVYVPKAPGAPNHHGLAVFAMDSERSSGLIDLLQLQDGAVRARYRDDFANTLSEELQQLNPNVANVVLSNEHCSSLQRTEEIERLRSLLSPHFDRFRIVFYLRSHDQIFTSSYTQRVKGGLSEASGSISDALRSNNYLALAERWAGVFGRDALRLRMFDRARFVNGDLIDDFCAAAEIPLDPEYERPERRNEGLSHNAVLFLRSVNEHLPPYVDGLPNPYRRRLVEWLSEGSKGGGIQVTRPQMEQLMTRYETSDAEVVERYFGESGPLFQPDLSQYPEDPPKPLSGADFAEIAAFLWVQQTKLIEELREAVRSSQRRADQDAKAAEQRLERTEQQLRTSVEKAALMQKELRSGRRALKTLTTALLARLNLRKRS